MMKHFVLQVLKLHTKLGKPIPSSDPVVVGATKATTVEATNVKPVTTAKPVVTPAAPAAATVVKKVLATPKITFVGMWLLVLSCKEYFYSVNDNFCLSSVRPI